jgi:hypothetical protein
MNGRNCEIYIDIYIYIYLYIYRYFTIKKNEILSFAGKWMELEIIVLSEISWKPMGRGEGRKERMRE